MTESTPQAKCGCLECRVRAALCGGEVSAPFEIDINDGILALGNILGEMLAHVPTKSAKRFVDELLVSRKKWQKHPRVMTQQPPAGHA